MPSEYFRLLSTVKVMLEREVGEGEGASALSKAFGPKLRKREKSLRFSAMVRVNFANDSSDGKDRLKVKGRW